MFDELCINLSLSRTHAPRWTSTKQRYHSTWIRLSDYILLGSQLDFFYRMQYLNVRVYRKPDPTLFCTDFIPIRKQIPEKEDVDMCGKVCAEEARCWLFVVHRFLIW